jgi:serine/threonine protein phosphatase 1
MFGSERIAVVGDVHGCSGKLRGLLARKELRDRHLIFVGDMIGRGEDSSGVLDTLAQIPAARRTLLLGNHEVALLSYLRDGDFALYMRLGGAPVVRSYVGVAMGDVGAQLRAAIPVVHRELLAAMATHHETDSFIASHMGINPGDPWSRSIDDMVLVPHPDLFTTEWHHPRLVICGHYASRGAQGPMERLICADRGCGVIADAPLGAVLLPELAAIAQ